MLAHIMSRTASPDYLLRADKLHLPSTDDCNIFDQVFDQELYDGGEEDQDDFQILADDPSYFATEPMTDDYPRLPCLSGSISHETSNERSPPQPWRKGVWCLHQDTLNIQKTRKPAVGTVSAVQLLNDQNLLIRDPPSPSLSPTMISTKRFVTSPNAVKHQHKANYHLALSREATLSPSPMHGQLPLQAKMEQVESWQQDFKNFNIRNSQGWQPGHSPTSLYRDHNVRVSHRNNAMVAKNADTELPQLASNDTNGLLDHQREDEKAIDPGLILNKGNNSAVQTQSAKPVPSHTFGPGCNPTCTTESLHSSNGSHQSSHDTLPHSLSSGISSNGIQSMPMEQHQAWWSPDMAPATPGWALTSREPFSGIAAPTPKRAATQSYVEMIDRHTQGLGIHYPGFNGSVRHGVATFYPSIEAVSPTRALYSPVCPQDLPASIAPVPPLPFPTPNQVLQHNSPFTTPHATRRSPTRLTSPPVSPLSKNPRSSQRQNRSLSRPEHPHNRRRRKSIYKPGPIKGTTVLPTADDPLPSATSHSSATTATNTATSTRARSRSHSKPPRTPRTPRTPKTPTMGGSSSNYNNNHNGASAAAAASNFNNSIDFVNFTARDSAKLLSDVAPSGSSKTRARREAEAREKRKRLGEAALRAVSSAGGDVEALRRAILA